MSQPARGDIWRWMTVGGSGVVLDLLQRNRFEPTIVVAPVFSGEPDAGFGVPLGGDIWAAPGFITSLRKSRLSEYRSRVDVQDLTNVNNMLFRILATPDR